MFNQFLILQNLSLQPFLLLSQTLLILVHQLLLRQHFLVIVKFNLLHNNKVMPVNDIFGHLFVNQILGTLSLRNSLLLVDPELSLLTCLNNLVTVLCKGLIPVQILALWNQYARVGFNQGNEIAE